MQEALPLALEFLDEHPDLAVRTLEQHDAQQVVVFLNSVPSHYAVLVLARSLPAFAAHLCQGFGIPVFASYLSELEVSRMVAVLRHLQPDVVEGILQETPQSRRKACLLLLHYPVQQIGAWIVPNTAVVSSDFTVREVLNFLRDATEDTFSKYVFVVNRAGIPEGRISYLTLLKAETSQKIEWLLEGEVGTLKANTLLSQAVKANCWHEGDVVPVVNSQQQFIGVLRHADLRRGLQERVDTRQRGGTTGDPLTGIFDVYGKSLLALFDSISNAVDTHDKP